MDRFDIKARFDYGIRSLVKAFVHSDNYVVAVLSLFNGFDYNIFISNVDKRKAFG